jgi:gas vesicle protein
MAYQFCPNDMPSSELLRSESSLRLLAQGVLRLQALSIRLNRTGECLSRKDLAMKLNKLVKSVLKTAVYLMDETADQMDRVSDRASSIAENARDIVGQRENHGFRNFMTFLLGVGVGVGAGMLLAPSSGEELRNTITDRVQDISERVTGRSEAYATGTDMR